MRNSFCIRQCSRQHYLSSRPVVRLADSVHPLRWQIQFALNVAINGTWKLNSSDEQVAPCDIVNTTSVLGPSTGVAFVVGMPQCLWTQWECLHKEHSPVGRCQGFVGGIWCEIKGSDRWTRFQTHKAVLTCTLPCRRQLLLIFLSDIQQPNLPKADWCGPRCHHQSGMWESTYCWGSKTAWQPSVVYISWMINRVGVLITRPN